VKRTLLEWLACPLCGGTLAEYVFAGTNDRIEDGLLVCARCERGFPIHREVPRLVVEPGYRHVDYDRRYGAQARQILRGFRLGGNEGPSSAGDPIGAGLTAIKRATAVSFGYEWTEYARFGWDGQPGGLPAERLEAITRSAFFHKAIVDPEEFNRKLVLDAGCGNGRYLNQAAELGAEVIGVDISGAVDIAHANIGHHPRVHVVQGDLFQLPIARGTFDRIFSIGVLMHTGDAERAFNHLATRLRSEGVISVHLYGRGNALYEFIDDRLRRRTTGMNHDRLLRASKRIELLPKALWATRRVTAGRPILYQLVNCFVRLEADHHCIFDWYSAPAATHHTYPEAFGWFHEAGLEVTDHRKRGKDVLRRLLKSPAAGVTVKGWLPRRG
jgi:SAM-dependent methyltransferase/uncharacterized protein YbaR (Trm112 family)